MNVYRTTLLFTLFIALYILGILLSSHSIYRELFIKETVDQFNIYTQFIMIALCCTTIYFAIRTRILFLREAANPNPESIDPAEM